MPPIRWTVLILLVLALPERACAGDIYAYVAREAGTWTVFMTKYFSDVPFVQVLLGPAALLATARSFDRVEVSTWWYNGHFSNQGVTMRAALPIVLVAIAAVSASAAVRQPECTMTARPMRGALQITAMVRRGFRVASNALHLIQIGAATPERPASFSTREVTFMTAPNVRTWTVALVLTDRNRSRTWTSFLKGTWDGKREDCVVQAAETGPTVPDSGVVERPPVLPALRDVPDAYKLPDAVKSKRDGHWSNVGPTTGPALGDK